jgi:hypothetical protein
MNKENKELLFKDLCGRLPYHVRVKVWLKDGTTEEGPLDLEHNYADVLRDAFYYNKIIDIKPYLRPMSSMTEEEAMEYANCGNIIANSPQNNYLIPNHNCVDWLNAHHFDHRGLIERGLAIAVTEGMYAQN